ncbi:GH39 family glycosyl hydrolase [Levilactobacillus enshiensis]|uniref:GH39 family glycosyl hydrolase n=1 Tax=Levilactobacillus enshiensis TaxID=2590213 RepID=UPI00117B2F2D|nr:glycosyl hydrolase [Levilactobacillus enshiensis]
MEMTNYDLSTNVPTSFRNYATRCIGTGRLGLALRQEYLEQLAYVQKNIGFEFIRGHGLFAEDVGIYQEYEDDEGKIQVEYNFTYLDQIMDAYRRLKLKPFLELGFMPQKLGSGPESVFYWHGNITPPADENKWINLVQATLKHLLARYGEEVIDWPIEIWNEPNIDQFWKNSDMKAYFHLFKITFQAVRAVNTNFKVGGPAICGVDDERWLTEFIAFCEHEKLNINFITRHFYTVTSSKVIGHYRYPDLRDADESLKELQKSREIINRSEMFSKLPMAITEFNTSYSPDAPLHDTVQNAVYTAYLLSKMGETSDLYSYWTFGDVFEEKGIPFTPFHGGFGLVANGSIPKPTYWTFKFFSDLRGQCILKKQSIIVMREDNGRLIGITWNSGSVAKNIRLTIPQALGQATIVIQTVDQNCGNPLKVWHALGEPASLDLEMTQLLRRSAVPSVNTDISQQGQVTMTVQPNSLSFFQIQPDVSHSDRGFDYQKLI